MSVTEFCIRRPVFATVINLVVILLGVICYQRLAVREYPNIDAPIINVETNYRGASSEIIETQVTKPLEDALSGLEGFDYMTSVSRQERSQITLHFVQSRDTDDAAADVRDRVSRARENLPDEVDEPIIAKVEADAQPIIYLAFSSDRHTPLEVTDVADTRVKDQVSALPGVAQVNIYGERRYAMRVWVDRDRLAAYRLTPADVERALRAQNLEIPAGRVESSEREFTVSGRTDLRTPEQFAQVILRADKGYLVRLGDIARIEQAAADDRVRARYNGKPAVALGVVQQSTGNPLDVSKALYDALPRIEKTLPEGMKVNIAYDKSVFIDRSIKAVYKTIIEAVFFVMLVIFLFLRTVRATLIPLVTIPLSLIGAFAVMELFGFSVNTLTLLSLVLAVGLVVDDAIVMVENIQRHIEEGMAPMQAAITGSREIAFAIVAMSITLAAVFAPIGFTEGTVGRLFTEFALTLAGAVLISGFVALTLSPMMCSRLLRSTREEGRFGQFIQRNLSNLTVGYQGMLARALERRGRVIVVMILTAVVGCGLYFLVQKELSPQEDRSLFIGMAIAPEGASLDYLDSYARKMEDMYSKLPEQIRYFVVAGFPVVNQAISFIGLKAWDQRDRGIQEILEEFWGHFDTLQGVNAFPLTPPALGQQFGRQPVQFVIQSTASYEELDQMVQKVLGAMGPTKMLMFPDTDLKLNKPELQFIINREKAELLGINVADIGNTLQILMSGLEVTRYRRGSDQYDVIVQVDPLDRRTPRDLTSIYMRATGGEMVQLSNLLEIKEVAVPRELNHFNKMRAVKISSGLTPGVSLGDALSKLEETVDKELGNTVAIDFDGESREFRTTGKALLVAFGLALIFIFLVLAAQYESYIDPLTIMLSVPLAITGALLTLFLAGGTLNVYSQIGLITLVGLITKHGILIVEFANHNRAKGMDVVAAVHEAATLRLRPILMTTAATILGAVPLALASGAGAESRQQIGWVIVGGMAFGTMLTLFVVPVAYTLLARMQRAKTEEEAVV